MFVILNYLTITFLEKHQNQQKEFNSQTRRNINLIWSYLLCVNILWPFHLLYNQVRLEFHHTRASILHFSLNKKKEQYEKWALLAPVHRKSVQTSSSSRSKNKRRHFLDQQCPQVSLREWVTETTEQVSSERAVMQYCELSFYTFVSIKRQQSYN